jgi:YVTN family beta-propeller protein
MSKFSSGRLAASGWSLWSLVALTALAACADQPPVGPGGDTPPGAPLLSTAAGGGTFAYVTNGGSGTVSVIRTADNTVTATVTVGGSPEGVAITPDGAFAYVTNSGSITGCS